MAISSISGVRIGTIGGVKKTIPGTSASATIDATFIDVIATYSSASNISLILPVDATIGAASGSRILISDDSTGQVEILPDTGVTITNPSATRVDSISSPLQLVWNSANSWIAYNGAGGFTGRAVVAGGNATYSNMEYVSIASAGAANNFGSFITNRSNLAGCASQTRGLFGGGGLLIDYITIANTGNSSTFANLNASRSLNGACSSSTRGIFAGGTGSVNTSDYVEIATIAAATNFGNLTVGRGYLAGFSSQTRGVFAGGYTTLPVSTIDFYQIASPGTATAFGSLSITGGVYGVAACSNNTRGIIFGGNDNTVNVTTIQWVTIASGGNSSNFNATLSPARAQGSGASSSTRGMTFGGNATTTVMDYVTIGTLGTVTNFGSLTYGRNLGASCSNAHGGL